MASDVSAEDGEGRSPFHIVLQDMAPRDAVRPSMPPSTAITDDAAADRPTLTRETNARHSETAPFLLLSMLMSAQLDVAPTAPLNTLDQAENQSSQVLDSAVTTSAQVLPTLSSSTDFHYTLPGLPPMSPPESYEVTPSFDTPAPAGVDQKMEAMGTAASLPSTDTPSLSSDTQGPMVADATNVSHLVATGGQTSPASGKLGRETEASATDATSAALIDGPTAQAQASLITLTPGNSAARSIQAVVSETQASPTTGTAGEVGATAEADWISRDQPDTSTSGDLNAPPTPRARRLESSEAPIYEVEAAQMAPSMRDTSGTIVQAKPADRPGAHAEPTPIIDQLINRLPVAVKDGQHELRLRLTPEHLGTVVVDISAGHLEVHARLLVENPAVKEALEANLHKLRDALQAQGLHVQGISVSVGEHTLQHESMAGYLSYDGRLWLPKGFTAGASSGDMAAGSERIRRVTDSRQVDLFI
jgi:flagellar hook-length control protein FliK